MNEKILLSSAENFKKMFIGLKVDQQSVNDF